MTAGRTHGSKAATLQQICDEGLALHQQGRLDEARALYKKVLVRDPKHFGALYLLGLLCARTGQGELGVSLMRRAMAVKPGIAGTHGELGDVLSQLGRREEAIANFDKAIVLKPDYFEAHHNRGVALQSLGRSDEAVASFDRAIGLRSDLARPFYNRGISLQASGRLDEALLSYDQAIARDPESAAAFNNRGVVLSLLGRHEAAVASFDRAVALEPGHAEAHDNRGISLGELGRHEEALASHEKAIDLDPQFPVAHYHRGGALGALRRHDLALDCYDRAIALKPDYVEAWANRAAALGGLRRHAEALASAEKAIATTPDHPPAHYAAGVALADLERFEDALASYDRAIELDTNYTDARLNRGMLLLLLGRFAPGWRDYEWRKPAATPATRDLPPERRWSGKESVSGKRLLIYHEQGLGDTIQFSRYMNLLIGRGAQIALAAPEALHPFVRRMFPDLDVIGPDERAGEVDLHCSLLSLPAAFDTTLESIPPPSPSLSAEVGRRALFEARLGPKTKPRVGIAWSGNPDHRNDHNRSIAFGRLLPLLTGDIEWVALQKEIRADDAAAFETRGGVGFHGEALDSFGDTAALVELMDLVITVDTSIAHLAGVMGKPTWILLPFMPDWRWMLNRPDSPWYPSAWLFRQPEAGDWESVLEAVGTELALTLRRG